VSNILDLGGGHTFTFLVDATGGRCGGIHEHPARTGEGNLGEGRCGGAITFRGHGDGSQWDVVQEDPLTLSPSLHCQCCGSHGWIRAGKWEEA
jgi:hypothetical protein